MKRLSRELPVLDIRQYYSDPSRFVENLRQACHKTGFFLLKHDIPSAQKQVDETRRFFKQSIEDKQSISYMGSPSFRGYMPMGVENTAGRVDLREQVEYAVEYPDDGDCGKAFPPYERLKGTNPWPDAFQPTFKPAMIEYTQHASRIADCIRRSLCSALGLKAEALDDMFHPTPHWAIKLVAYPPVISAEGDTSDESQSFGVGAHTDTNFLTLVLQDSVGGLQVYSEGEFINVPSDLGADVLVCNLGEQAQILSNGYFLATPHRVLSNRNSTERISVPLFYNPTLSSVITPLELPATLEWERPKEYQNWERSHNAMMATVGDNTFKSLARSHPTVFQRHHSDLELLEDGQILAKNSQSSS